MHDGSRHEPRLSTRARIGIAGFGAGTILVAALAVAAGRVGPTPAAGTSAAPATAEPQACSAAVRQDIQDVVEGQLAAFADRDWSRALSFSSAGFRDRVGPEQLEQIILEGYPLAADAQATGLGQCAVSGTFAQAEVAVTHGSGRVLDLVYLLALEEGGWRISGAGERAGGPQPAPMV